MDSFLVRTYSQEDLPCSGNYSYQARQPQLFAPAESLSRGLQSRPFGIVTPVKKRTPNKDEVEWRTRKKQDRRSSVRMSEGSISVEQEIFSIEKNDSPLKSSPLKEEVFATWICEDDKCNNSWVEGHQEYEPQKSAPTLKRQLYNGTKLGNENGNLSASFCIEREVPLEDRYHLSVKNSLGSRPSSSQKNHYLNHHIPAYKLNYLRKTWSSGLHNTNSGYNNGTKSLGFRTETSDDCEGGSPKLETIGHHSSLSSSYGAKVTASNWHNLEAHNSSKNWLSKCEAHDAENRTAICDNDGPERSLRPAQSGHNSECLLSIDKYRKKYLSSKEETPNSNSEISQANWIVQRKNLHRLSFPAFDEPRSRWLKKKPTTRKSLPADIHDLKPNFKMKESQLTDFSSGIGFVDSHCHLDFLFRRMHFFNSFAAFKRQCRTKEQFPSNFEGCISIFCEPVTFGRTSFWEKLLLDETIWGAFGCHPHFADTFDRDTEILMQNAFDNPKVVALGEIGLDYSSKNTVPPEIQKHVLRKQIEMAVSCDKPIVIHCRDAHSDCLQLCREHIPSDHSIHRHCFTDTWKEAGDWMRAFPNLKFGFTCLITRRGQSSLRTVVKNLPLDKILIETDAPYFKPLSVKNMDCSHPGMAIHVAREVAIIKEQSLDEVLTQVRKNTRQIYSI